MEPTTALMLSSLFGQGIQGLFKTGVGIGQWFKGNRMLNEWEKKRPTMEIPESINRMVEVLGGMSQIDRLPGQDIMTGNIKSGTASGIEAIKDMSRGGEGLGAITKLISGEQNQFGDMQNMLANMVFQNKGRYAQGLGEQGQWEQQAWDWNKKQKWGEKMAEANARMGAGQQNFLGGMGGLGKGGGDIFAGLSDNPSGFGGGGADEDYTMIAKLLKEMLEQ